MGIAVYETYGSALAVTFTLGTHFRSALPVAAQARPQGEFFDEMNVEVTHLARDLGVARAAAEEEARLRDTNATQWTAERLRVSLRSKWHDKTLFVVSNREPYIHMRGVKEIETILPASGVVTALEPVLLACDGTGIAHGSGTAESGYRDAEGHFAGTP